MLTHGNLRANLEQMLGLPGEIVRADDVSLAAVPLFHVFGLNVALGLSLATGGGPHPGGALRRRRLPPDRPRARASRTLLGVPAMFAAWVALAMPCTDRRQPGAATTESPSGPKTALAGVRRAISGAAALTAEVAVRFEAAYGVPVWQGYGLTEAARPWPPRSARAGTGPARSGRPLPGVEVRWSTRTGEDVLEGDPGEIWVRGRTSSPATGGTRTATAEVLTDDGWLRTGDIGVIGEDGRPLRRRPLQGPGHRVGVQRLPGRGREGRRRPARCGRGRGARPARPRHRGDRGSGHRGGARGHGDRGARSGPTAPASLARYKCPTTVRFVAELPHGLAGKALRRALRREHG